MTRVRLATVLILALSCIALPAAAQQATAKPPSNDWLLDAPDDTERFKLLQRYLRGFDQPMWEVGERYRGVHDALTRNNFDLAIYHWDKIKTTIENGFLKRPARRANAETVFLNKAFGDVRAAFETRDSAKAWAGFTAARNACMACHVAEKMAFMNDQEVFDKLTAPK